MKKLSTLLIIVLSVFFAFGQNLDPSSYDGISKDAKKRIFLDNFDSNKYSWIRKTSPPTHKIQDGFLYFSNEYDFPYVDGKAISYNGNKNWEIETKIKFISGDVEAFNGLMWGQLIFGEKYVFSFSSMGYHQIEFIDGYNQSFIVKPENTGVINKTSENDIVVRKYEGKYYFFINKVLIYSTNFNDLPGQYIGFSVAPNSMMRIYYLKLWYID
ncbi:MAG: hypothetical protein U9Q83_08825 [Bacteroidota bacterium]|nr:hypothetical protein [Bacteroidota bacterium]